MVFTKWLGFSDWKHALGKSGALVGHDCSYSHKQSMISWNEFKLNAEKRISVADRLASVDHEERVKN